MLFDQSLKSTQTVNDNHDLKQFTCGSDLQTPNPFATPCRLATMWHAGILGSLVVVLISLKGCGDVFYENEADALSKICGGSSCPDSCRCCVQSRWADAEACVSGMAQGTRPDACSYCISSATEGWEPEDCKTERNMGYCGYQYWDNSRAECEKYNETCGSGFLSED